MGNSEPAAYAEPCVTLAYSEPETYLEIGTYSDPWNGSENNGYNYFSKLKLFPHYFHVLCEINTIFLVQT